MAGRALPARDARGLHSRRWLAHRGSGGPGVRGRGRLDRRRFQDGRRARRRSRALSPPGGALRLDGRARDSEERERRPVEDLSGARWTRLIEFVRGDDA